MKLGELFSGDAVVDAQHADVAVAGVAMDSRAVKPGDVFFALAGVKTDGARFIDQAIASGAVAVVSDRIPEGDHRVPFIAVPNPRRALALAAAKFYARQPAIIAAVTGTKRQDIGRSVHAADLAASRLCRRKHRHHRTGVAEAHHLRLADHA